MSECPPSCFAPPSTVEEQPAYFVVSEFGSRRCVSANLVTLGHDQCRATAFVPAAKPAGIKTGPVQILVGQIAVLADLHWLAATRTRIAVPRNDPDEMTLSLFLAHVLAVNSSEYGA